MGSFTNKERAIYENICHLNERSVLAYMKDLLTAKYGKESVIATRAYVVAIGDIPVALVAHADTVFKTVPRLEKFFYDQEADVIWNPDGAGADDRAGIYSISYILRKTKLRPHIIITTGEESGCIGASKLTLSMHTFPADLRFMIQLDRRGEKDSVYYDLESPEFEEFINSYGFETEWGTFTDISVLAPAWKIAAVNFSIGYTSEHSQIEHLNVLWMYNTIHKTIHILQEVNADTPKFAYKEKPYSLSFYNHSAWYDYDSDFVLPDGHCHCMMCNTVEKQADMLPIWYPHGVKPYHICLECYSGLINRIVWCKTCGKGIFLSQEEASKIKDVNNWICEECKKNDTRSEDSRAV